jgi:hypothetical protein
MDGASIGYVPCATAGKISIILACNTQRPY